MDPPSKSSKTSDRPHPPTVPQIGPPGAFLVELLIYSGWPFKNHWAYFVRSHDDPNIGVLVNAVGSLMDGFKLEIERSHDLDSTSQPPIHKIPLQWVSQEFFDEQKMLNFGEYQVAQTPLCDFEESAAKVEPPGKSLRDVTDKITTPPRRVVQKNCQTWIIESAHQLVRDNIFHSEVAIYLQSIEDKTQFS